MQKNRTSIALLVSLQFILKKQYQKRGHKVEDPLNVEWKLIRRFDFHVDMTQP